MGAPHVVTSDKFGDHGHSESGDMFLICQMTSRDHILKDYVTLRVGASHSKYYPVKFGTNKHCGTGDIKALVYHVILQDNVTLIYVTLWRETPRTKTS